MKLKTLIALAVAGAFAVPLAAQASADGDRIIVAQAGGAGGAGGAGDSGAAAGSSSGTGATGGGGAAGGTTTAPAGTHPQGSPPAPAPAGAPTGASGGATTSAMFSQMDTNNDGQISRAEWDAHHRSGSGSTRSR